MNRSNRCSRRRVLGAAGLALGALPAWALAGGTYPDRAVKVIVPFAAGGTAGAIVRAFAAHLERRLGQPFIAEHIGGAGTTLGSEAVAKSAADGYTLLATNGDSLLGSVALYKHLTYDPRRDLAFVAIIGSAPVVLAVNAAVPAADVKAFVAYAQSRVGSLSFGSTGAGSLNHLAGETLMNRIHKLAAVHVPYRGQAPLLQDLVGQQITAAFGPAPAFAAFASQQRLRLLGVTGPRRLPLLPDVKTFAEQGVNDEVMQLQQWFALLAPAATPRETVALLNAEVLRALDEPDIKAMLDGFGLQPQRGTPEQAQTLFARELAVVPRLIRELGVQAQ